MKKESSKIQYLKYFSKYGAIRTDVVELRGGGLLHDHLLGLLVLRNPLSSRVAAAAGRARRRARGWARRYFLPTIVIVD